MPYAKTHIRVKVPHRSGFDKTHRNSGSGLVGQLLPLLCDEVIPNSRISLRIPLSVSLPPLVSDTYMNMKHKVEAFFVPGRLLCRSYEPWFCDRIDRAFYSGNAGDNQQLGVFQNVKPAVPCLSIESTATIPTGSGSLLDYLGFGHYNTYPGESINVLPLIAYHLVWQEYYRNPSIQNPAFCVSMARSADLSASSVPRIANVTDAYFHYANSDFVANFLYSINSSNQDSFKCADGVSLFDIRQRNFGLDLFTSARKDAQQGSAAAVSLSIPAGTDAAGGSTNFTIAQLRAANSLQMFRERNNLPGTRLVEQVKARYGANLSDGVAQRPICIGSATYDYGSKGVSQTAPASGSGVNPFDGIAAQYGRAYASGSDFIISDFVANEPGYILVLHSQVPEVTYTYGIEPHFTRYVGDGSIVDMANPLLQNVGDEPIECRQVSGDASVNNVFGYNDRYCNFMFRKNSVHGKLRYGENLASFVLQNPIIGSPVQSTSFLEIPTDYLDSVMQVSSAASGLTFWYDSMLEYKVSMPLAEFSIPSLQDPAYEHGQSVNLRRNGQIF